MTWDPPPATATAAQNTASNNGSNLDAWMLGCLDTLCKHLQKTLSAYSKGKYQYKCTNAPYLTGPMTVSEGGRVQGDK